MQTTNNNNTNNDNATTNNTNSNNKGLTMVETITTGYTNALEAGFNDHGILVGTIVLLWNTLKFIAIIAMFLLTGGLAIHGWLRTNSAVYNTIDDTSILSIGSQDTLDEVVQSTVTDVNNTIDKFTRTRRRTKANSDRVNSESDAILNDTPEEEL